MKVQKKIEAIKLRLKKIADKTAKKPSAKVYFEDLLKLLESGCLPTSAATIIEPSDLKARKKVLNVLNGATIDYDILEKLKAICNR